MKKVVTAARASKSHPILSEVYKLAIIIFGAFLVALGLEGFLIPNGFIDGGVTGVSIILATIFKGVPMGVFLAILNIPFVVLAWRKLGRRNAVRTIVGVVTLAGATIALHHIDPFTDEFFIAMFMGGTLVGLGIGLALRQGGALDGTESLAAILASNTRYKVDQIILAINCAIFVIAAFLLTPEAAMASALMFWVVGSKVIEWLTHGVSRMQTATVVTAHGKEVAKAVYDATHHRVGMISKRIYNPETEEFGLEVYNLTFAISRLEETSIAGIIADVDPDATFALNDGVTLRGGIYNDFGSGH